MSRGVGLEGLRQLTSAQNERRALAQGMSLSWGRGGEGSGRGVGGEVLTCIMY